MILKRQANRGFQYGAWLHCNRDQISKQISLSRSRSSESRDDSSSKCSKSAKVAQVKCWPIMVLTFGEGSEDEVSWSRKENEVVRITEFQKKVPNVLSPLNNQEVVGRDRYLVNKEKFKLTEVPILECGAKGAKVSGLANRVPQINNTSKVNGPSSYIAVGPPLYRMALDDNRDILMAKDSGLVANKAKRWKWVNQRAKAIYS